MSRSHDDDASGRQRPDHLHLVGSENDPRRTDRELSQCRLRLLQRWLVFAMVAGLVLSIGWVALGFHRSGALEPVPGENGWRVYWHGLRAALLVAAVVFWPTLIGRLSDWLRMGSAFRQAMIAWRWRAALLMLLIELVVIHEVPRVFLQRLLGGAE